jgi:hypothetical protein
MMLVVFFNPIIAESLSEFVGSILPEAGALRHIER